MTRPPAISGTVRQVHGELPHSTEQPPPLVSVHIGGSAHDAARRGALEKLKAHPPVDAELAETIAYELQAFEHAWRPDLTEFDPRYNWEYDSPDRRVDTFMYGGLLFGHFANQANVPHLLYGLRGKLDQAAALNAAATFSSDEASLDEALTNVLKSAVGAAWVEGTRALPPVLPYLLQQYEPASLPELLLRALELRGTDMMKDYRHWKNAAVSSLQRTGAIPADVQRDVRAAADAIEKRLTPTTAGWTTVLRIVPVPTIPLASLGRLGNWALATVPGRNHVKMLYRLQLASQNLALGGGSLESPLRRLWSLPR